MTDEQDAAEALDDDVIAADDDADDVIADEADIDDPDPTGEGRFAGIAGLEEDFPPDRSLGVEDPGRYAIDDDVAAREAREEEADTGRSGEGA